MPEVLGEKPSGPVVTDTSIPQFSKQVILNEQLGEIQETQEKKEGKEKPVIKKQTAALEALNKLIAKGEYSEIKEVAGVKWEMAALDEDDLLAAQRDAVTLGLHESDNGRYNAVRLGVLSFSLRSVNGSPIYEMFKNEINAKDFSKNQDAYRNILRLTLRSYIGKLAPTIIDKLWDEYVNIATKRDKELNEVKNS